MRQIILDTETTGLEVARGHRIIEIGCIELCERRRSGREFHRYLNPQREVDRGAAEVHGLTDEFLADKPLFAQIADEFLGFIEGAELIMHNASFDVGFLDAELSRLDPAAVRISERCSVLDTLKLARERFPGQRNSLDALCKRLGVDNTARELHGALLDANLLAEVYLSLTAGQGEMSFDSAPASTGAPADNAPRAFQGALRVLRAGAEELAAHEARLDAVAKAAKQLPLWRTLQP